MFLEDKCLLRLSKTLYFTAFVNKSYKNTRTKKNSWCISIICFFIIEKDLNLKKANAVKKTIDNRF